MRITPEDVATTAVKIFPIMGRLMDSYMRVGEHSLSAVHFQVLTALLGEPHTVTALAERHSVSAASMSKTLMVMEERGWVARERDAADRRVVRMAMTAAGYGVMRDVETRSKEYLTETFKTLSEDELAIIMDGLEHLIKAFAHSPHAGRPQTSE